MRYVTVLFGLIAVLAFVGCGDDNPASSAPEEGLAASAGKLVISTTRAGGYRGPRVMMAMHRAAMDAFNDHDLDRQQSYYAEDIFFESLGAPPPANGKAEFRLWMEAFYIAFPDVQSTVLNRRTSGNILVSEEIYTGTHSGDFGGIPATGQVVQAPVLNVAEYEGDKIKHQTHYWDMVGLMVQMGIMPAGELPPLEPSITLPDPQPTGMAPLAAQTEAMARWNSGDLALWAQMIRPDVDAFYNVLGASVDRDALVALNEMYFLGFPDIQGEIVRMVDMGDGWILCEAVFRGTHDGPYLGVPATGSPTINRVAWVSRFDADGLLTYFHVYFDNLGVLVQIGAIPAP